MSHKTFIWKNHQPSGESMSQINWTQTQTETIKQHKTKKVSFDSEVLMLQYFTTDSPSIIGKTLNNYFHAPSDQTTQQD